jgi:hypothetical protein
MTSRTFAAAAAVRGGSAAGASEAVIAMRSRIVMRELTGMAGFHGERTVTRQFPRIPRSTDPIHKLTTS